MELSEVPDQLLECHLPPIPVLKSQELLFKKQKGRFAHREKRLVGGGGGSREGLGVWDEQVQTIIYRMDTVYTGNYSQCPVIKA